MPCRWEASERPLHVRTVWIRGIRHALLTREELTRSSRPRTASAKSETCKRNAEEVAERVCRWLASSRPLTPYGGSLWETPRNENLDVRSSKARLSSKTPGPGPTCSPLDTPQTGLPVSPTETLTPKSPPVVRTYEASPPKSAASRRSVTFHNTPRPKLHIFMPDTRQHLTTNNSKSEDSKENFIEIPIQNNISLFSNYTNQ